MLTYSVNMEHMKNANGRPKSSHLHLDLILRVIDQEVLDLKVLDPDV